MRGSALILVFWFVLFSALAAVGYYIWTNYSKTPSPLTKKTANGIYKYPTASTWQLTETKNLCLKPTNCAQPIKIFFETPNNWSDIYNYYNTYFKNSGWSTNTNVVTSIPTSVVYNKDDCRITMENISDIKYSLAVSCMD